MADFVVAYDLAGDTFITEPLATFRTKADNTYRVVFRGDSAEECAKWQVENDSKMEDARGTMQVMARQERDWKDKEAQEKIRTRNQAAAAIVQAIANIAGGPFAGTPPRCKFCGQVQSPPPPAPATHAPHCPYPASAALVAGG